MTVMPCNICCVEPGFCGECCCILCNKFIDLNYGGYSYIKCEAHVSGGYICGHVAHLNCALRCYLAGTVGGSIGLDAEYFCRICDAKTDLILHVSRFVQICKSINSRDEVQKLLNVGVCILCGLQKTRVKELLKRIELAIKKVTIIRIIRRMENLDEENTWRHMKRNKTRGKDPTRARKKAEEYSPEKGLPSAIPSLGEVHSALTIGSRSTTRGIEGRLGSNARPSPLETKWTAAGQVSET